MTTKLQTSVLTHLSTPAIPPQTLKMLIDATGKASSTVRKALKGLIDAGAVQRITVNKKGTYSLTAKPKSAPESAKEAPEATPAPKEDAPKGKADKKDPVAEKGAEAAKKAKPAPKADPNGPVPRELRNERLMNVFNAGEKTLTASEAADALKLEGTYRAQAAVAALTSLVKQGKLAKVKSEKGVTHYRLA